MSICLIYYKNLVYRSNEIVYRLSIEKPMETFEEKRFLIELLDRETKFISTKRHHVANFELDHLKIVWWTFRLRMNERVLLVN